MGSMSSGGGTCRFWAWTLLSSRPDGDGRLWGDGFEVETLIHVRVAKAGLVIAEVPSFEHPRLHGVSNLNAFRDGRRVLQTILAERRRPRSQPGIGAIQPLIRLLPSMAARTVHERTFSSELKEE